MGSLKFVIQCLAVYLMVTALLGTSIQIEKFIASVSKCLVRDIAGAICNGRECPPNTTYQLRPAAAATGIDSVDLQSLNDSYLKYFIHNVESLYFFTFPVISPIFAKDLSNGHLRNPYQIDNDLNACFNKAIGLSTSTILAVLLPSFFLLKGSFKINYSNCKFWYYTQVGALLISCFKIVLITLLDLWDVTTNAALIAVLLGLGQLWLVQSFMEKLERQQRNDVQNRVSSQLLALNDLETVVEVCKKVGGGDYKKSSSSKKEHVKMSV